MVSISRNGIIVLNQGDTFTFPIRVDLGTTMEPAPYPMAEGDLLYFAVMEPNQVFDDAIIKKVFDWTDFNAQQYTVDVHFKFSDTANLLPGVYYYSVKLIRNHSLETVDGWTQTAEPSVNTIIPKTKLIIVE